MLATKYLFTVGAKLMGKSDLPQGSFSGRSLPRAPVVMPCRLSWAGVDALAITRNLSPTGLALSLSETIPLKMKEKAQIHLHNRITLQVVPVHARHEPGRLVAGFKVATIEKGAQEWNDLVAKVET